MINDYLTLLLQKDSVELTGCLFKESVYTFLMMPSKIHEWSNPTNGIG